MGNKIQAGSKTVVLGKIKKAVLPVLMRFGVRKAGLFGSVARGEARKKSDIDLLVEFPKNKSLLDFIGLKQDLEKVLGRKVDVVEYACIHPRLKEQILKEEVRVA